MGSRQKFTVDDFYYELEDKFLDEFILGGLFTRGLRNRETKRFV